MLAPYDEENTLDEPIIAMTKEDAVARCRSDIERVKNGVYKKKLARKMPNLQFGI